MPPDRERRDRRRRRSGAATTTRRSSTATNAAANDSCSDADPSAASLAMTPDHHHRHHRHHIYPPPSAPTLSTTSMMTSISADDEGRSTCSRRVRIDDNNIASTRSAYCSNNEDSTDDDEEEEEEVCINVEVTASSTMESTACSNSFDTCTAPKTAIDGHTSSRRQSAPTGGTRHNLPPTSPTPTWPNSQLYQSLESMAASVSRLSATLLFTLWLVTGLPLLLLLPCTYDTAAKRMKYGPCHPMVLLLSFSWLINATLIICSMHALSYMDSGMTPWQAAALGWTIGVSGVTYLQASLDGRTSEAMHRIMLRPFGIQIRPGGEGNTVGWLPSLVGMIPAIVLYFIADWFGEVREELACDEADDSSATSIPESFGGNSTNVTLPSRICPPWALPSPDGTLCCHVENQTGNWLEFAAYLAGSVLAGWAVIRFVAIFLIWGDDDIDLEDDVGGLGTYAKGTNGIGNAEAAERVKDVLVSYSRGEVSKNEIEMMLNRC